MRELVTNTLAFALAHLRVCRWQRYLSSSTLSHAIVGKIVGKEAA
jgi:hypothetical protein